MIGRRVAEQVMQSFDAVQVTRYVYRRGQRQIDSSGRDGGGVTGSNSKNRGGNSGRRTAVIAGFALNRASRKRALTEVVVRTARSVLTLHRADHILVAGGLARRIDERARGICCHGADVFERD